MPAPVDCSRDHSAAALERFRVRGFTECFSKLGAGGNREILLESKAFTNVGLEPLS